MAKKTCRTCEFFPSWCVLGHHYDTYRCFLQPCNYYYKREASLLVDVLAKLVRETRQLAISEGWKAPPPWWREIDAALARHQQEVDNGTENSY